MAHLPSTAVVPLTVSDALDTVHALACVDRIEADEAKLDDGLKALARRQGCALDALADLFFQHGELERAAITDAASTRGMTRTGWIASLLRSRLSLGLSLTGGEEEALRAIARELNRIGGNVDQIARAANAQALAGKPVDVDAAALAEAVAAVREATSELR